MVRLASVLMFDVFFPIAAQRQRRAHIKKSQCDTSTSVAPRMHISNRSTYPIVYSTLFIYIQFVSFSLADSFSHSYKCCHFSSNYYYNHHLNEKRNNCTTNGRTRQLLLFISRISFTKWRHCAYHNRAKRWPLSGHFRSIVVINQLKLCVCERSAHSLSEKKLSFKSHSFAHSLLWEERERKNPNK